MVLKSLQLSSNGESISLQSQPNPSLEILKIFEHISFGISDPTIYFYSKHNSFGLSLLDQIFKISETRISHSKWHIEALLAIAGKLICLYKIKLICISQLECLIQWLLCVCFLYEPGSNPSGLPSPETPWFIVNQVNIASNVNVWTRRFGWRKNWLPWWLQILFQKSWYCSSFLCFSPKDGMQLEK